MSPEPVGSGAEDAIVERPVLRVVRGAPDAVELAALVAVVSAAASGDDAPAPSPSRPAWASPTRSVRAPLPSGGWRASAAPR